MFVIKELSSIILIFPTFPRSSSSFLAKSSRLEKFFSTVDAA